MGNHSWPSHRLLGTYSHVPLVQIYEFKNAVPASCKPEGSALVDLEYLIPLGYRKIQKYCQILSNVAKVV